MSLRVHVNPELVERATVEDSRHCMVAEALQLARPHFKNILVDVQTIRWTNPRTSKRYIALTPEIAAQALVDFDQGNPIQPFSFALEPVQVTAMKPRGEGSGTRAASTKRSLKRTGAGTFKIEGGKPLPAGHLRGGGNAEENAAASKLPPDDASNVVRSSRRYRRYGLRLLKG